MLVDFRRGVLAAGKDFRDEIDQKLPNVSTRRDDAVLLQLELNYIRRLLRPEPATEQQMLKLSLLLESEPDKLGRSAYQAQARELWKAIKTAIDPRFEMLKHAKPAPAK
jgi:hypothetical protein